MERKSIVLGAIIAVAIVILLAKFLFSDRELVPLTQSEKVVFRVSVGRKTLSVLLGSPLVVVRKNSIGIAKQPNGTHVGGEFLFKLPLAADTSDGSRNSIGNYSGEQCFDQCWPASGQELSLRVLGEHGPGCNIL